MGLAEEAERYPWARCLAGEAGRGAGCGPGGPPSLLRWLGIRTASGKATVEALSRCMYEWTRKGPWSDVVRDCLSCVYRRTKDRETAATTSRYNFCYANARGRTSTWDCVKGLFDAVITAGFCEELDRDPRMDGSGR